MPGNHGLPLCGRSFWVPRTPWGALITLEESLWFLLLKVFCNSKVTFPFLCTYQYDSIHHAVFGGCHCRLLYWFKNTLRASLAHYGISGIQHAWNGVECFFVFFCFFLNEVRCGMISMGWIRKLGSHSRRNNLLGTSCLWGFCLWLCRLGPAHKCLTDGAGHGEWNLTPRPLS